MIDYIFFDDGLRARFADFLQANGVSYTEEPDPLGSGVVSIPEDLDEDLYDAIDLHYDELTAMQAELLEQTEDRLEKNVAGIRVTLSDGRPCMVRLNPDLVSRVLTVLSLEELQEMVTVIARCGENPDDLPVCHTREDLGVR